MSPSWNESLRVALCPDRVGLVRLNRGWRPRLVEASMKPVPAADAGTPAWSGALAALTEELARMDGQGSEITVVLSNHFVRYQLVPPNAALSGEAEAIVHARHRFAKVYGSIAEAWDIRLSSAHGGPQVASAVDAGLLAGLDQAVAASGRRLVSVQPYLMAAFNRWRKTFNEPLVWFVLTEQGRLCLTALQQGRWHQLSNQQIDADWSRHLPDLLSRQRKLSGLDGTPGKVYLFASDEEAELASQAAGEPLHVLHLTTPLRPRFSPDEAACYAMALNG